MLDLVVGEVFHFVLRTTEIIDDDKRAEYLHLIQTKILYAHRVLCV